METIDMGTHIAGLFAASSEPPDAKMVEAAVALGAAIGREGLGLIYGGTRMGLMGRAARAAGDAGADVTGIINRVFVDQGLADTDCKLTVVNTLSERKRLMFLRSDGFFVLPGGVGTLDEVFEMLAFNALEHTSKPLIFLNINKFYEPIRRLLNNMLNMRLISPHVSTPVHFESSPVEAVGRMMRIISS